MDRITETITFHFDNVEQQKRFHERLDGKDGFAEQMWGLSILAQAELDIGSVDGAQKTLARITEVASEKINT